MIPATVGLLFGRRDQLAWLGLVWVRVRAPVRVRMGLGSGFLTLTLALALTLTLTCRELGLRLAVRRVHDAAQQALGLGLRLEAHLLMGCCCC